MAIAWLMIGMAAASAFGLLTLIAGTDTRPGVDGDGFHGRGPHRADTWW